MKETLTPEQKEIALKARRDYYRGRLVPPRVAGNGGGG